MASYQKINGKWRAYVQINGIRRSRYFRTKAEAVRWTQPLEETIRTKGMIPSETKFAVLLDEYYHGSHFLNVVARLNFAVSVRFRKILCSGRLSLEI